MQQSPLKRGEQETNNKKIEKEIGKNKVFSNDHTKDRQKKKKKKKITSSLCHV